MSHMVDVPTLCLSNGSREDEAVKYMMRKQARRNIDLYELPASVVKFDNQRDNSQIYLIGTAHFSKESCKEVEELISAVQPDVVMLELCKSRANILIVDEKSLMEEAKNIDMNKIRSIIAKEGIISGIMRILFLNMTASITKQLGVTPGCEFRSAVGQALRVPGCKVHLGDRPIEITMKRMMGNLSIWQRLKLMYHLITSDTSITKEEMEKMKDQDLLVQLLREMTDTFPALAQVIVDERDTYLAYSLLQSKEIAFKHLDSLWNPDPPVVVGIVGLGHVNGVVENWGKPMDVKSLLTVPKSTITSRMLSLTGRAVIYSAAIYGIYHLCRWKCIDF